MSEARQGGGGASRPGGSGGQQQGSDRGGSGRQGGGHGGGQGGGPPRQGGQNRDRGNQRNKGRQADTGPFFDPQESETRLYDELAEKQAKAMPDNRKHRITSSQLRRFYGEIKTLHRQYDAATRGQGRERKNEIYQRSFEPQFRMVRSKVAYAGRRSGQSGVPKEFATMLEKGISKVRNGRSEDFEKFVTHLEAVVGFMYGRDRVTQ